MTIKQQVLFDKNLQINEEILSTNTGQNSNYSFIEPWKSLNEFCSILGVDYAARCYFHRLINIGDKIMPDMSKYKSSSYWGKKYDQMKGVVVSVGISSVAVNFENGDNFIYIDSANIVEINEEKNSYQNYLEKINELRDLEKSNKRRKHYIN